MMCAWKQLLAILPPELSQKVDRAGRESIAEIRLRLDAPPELVSARGNIWLDCRVRQEDIHYVMNAASRYSPWCAATMEKGYLTAPGGHRIGICGVAQCRKEDSCTFQAVESLCIRVARDFPGIADRAGNVNGSVLILGAPGWGKTTLLRDLSRRIAQTETVCVVDTRGELFPAGLQRGRRMDVLTGVPKLLGIEMVLRTMGPAYIALDEITAQEDCLGLIQAANCGVRLLATAHAASEEDLKKRDLYRGLLNRGIFQTRLQLCADRSYRVERMVL